MANHRRLTFGDVFGFLAVFLFVGCLAALVDYWERNDAESDQRQAP